MASGVTNTALRRILTGQLDLAGVSLKVMLVDDGFALDKEVDVVDPDDDGANDAHHHEIVATNYTKGFGSASRKSTTATVQKNDVNNRAEVVLTDCVWTSLGNGVNDTVGMALLILEGTSDQDSLVIAAFDFANTATDGNDFTVDFDGVNGNIRIGS